MILLIMNLVILKRLERNQFLGRIVISIAVTKLLRSSEDVTF